MQKIQTEILVIGGGATGTGILRDLAMRGFQAILVERRDLTHGTTGRFHGLLHSGGRYAVKDPEAARECIEENRILRKIMPHCIEDTNGFFVLTPDDDPDYVELFLSGCQKAGIPTEEVPIRRMLEREPSLNPEISQCIMVPDGAADSFAAAHANIASAREHGAEAFTYHEVTSLLMEANKKNAGNPDPNSSQPNKVIGALCHDLVKDQSVEIHADLIVNAAGAWVGKIGATAGIEIAIRPGKGTMIAVSHRVVNTVINRLKMPSDGDILVPAHTVAVMGTTDEQVPDPDEFGIERWEIQHMLAEGEKIIPGFGQLRMLRAWAGVRPLYQETKTDQSRDITRSFVLLDHEERDGVPGLLTITSGKWTTYRKMAEITVDKVCEKLNTERICRTHQEELPSETTGFGARAPGQAKEGKERRQASSRYYRLGHRLAHIEHQKTYGHLICECELATQADIEQAIIQGQAKTLDDIRRDVRLGMGPCQGGFCTFRAAGILHRLSQGKDHPSTSHLEGSITNINASIRDFLQERWKGLLPILWGQQLRQESLNEFLYLNVLNVDHLPGPASSRLGPEYYLEASGKTPKQKIKAGTVNVLQPLSRNIPLSAEIIIIGAGLAGLNAAWQLADRGKRVRLVAKGWGANYWASGCIDILGYYPVSNAAPINAPISSIARLAMEQVNHPYAKISLRQIETALKTVQSLCTEAGYPLKGSIENNWHLPTAAGAIRPTCLAPETFLAGDLSDPSPMLLIGIEGYNDFYPHLAAANLKKQGFSAEAVIIQIPGLQNRERIDSMILAHYFDDLETANELADILKPYLKTARRIGFPAVLGNINPLGFVQVLETLLGCRVFEIPGLPPSIPGMRLHRIFVDAIKRSGGQVFQGMEVIQFRPSDANDQIEAIITEAAARSTSHTARNFILATGGILGGGIVTTPAGEIVDPIFDLDVDDPPEIENWFKKDFLDPDGHPILAAGITTNQDFRTKFNNLFTVGGALTGNFVREGSLEGIALASSYHVAEILA